MEDTYLCHQCKNIFRLPPTCNIAPVEEVIKCPICGNTDVEGLPSWAPAGLAEFSSTWEYECQQCKNIFELPVPSSPSQEKEIKCPVCKSGHIHRLTSTGSLPMYCG